MILKPHTVVRVKVEINGVLKNSDYSDRNGERVRELSGKMALVKQGMT